MPIPAPATILCIGCASTAGRAQRHRAGRRRQNVIITVRDPLCFYDGDPAEQFVRHLDYPHPGGCTGMFSTWTGTYRRASVSIVSGGSSSPDAELIMHELFKNTAGTAYMRLGGSGGMHLSVPPGALSSRAAWYATKA
jgi:uridine phosphorylase